MVYIESPNTSIDTETTSVFLAGGIQNCSDWQSEIVDNLKNENVIVYNPRRRDFPIHDPTAATAQIQWEFKHLRLADIISFWFCAETLCPIVLYELGAWSRTAKDLVIGVDPKYVRRQDVEIQTELIRPDIQIVYSLDDLTYQIKSVLNN